MSNIAGRKHCLKKEQYPYEQANCWGHSQGPIQDLWKGGLICLKMGARFGDFI